MRQTDVQRPRRKYRRSSQRDERCAEREPGARVFLIFELPAERVETSCSPPSAASRFPREPKLETLNVGTQQILAELPASGIARDKPVRSKHVNLKQVDPYENSALQPRQRCNQKFHATPLDVSPASADSARA